MWNKLHDVLTDFDFLQARLGCPCGVPGDVVPMDVFDVLDDFVAALEADHEVDAWKEVADLYQVIDGDSHVLKRDASIVLQQAFNALSNEYAAPSPLGQRL